MKNFQQSDLGAYIQKSWNLNLKEYLYFHVHCIIIDNSQTREAIKVSINRWMDLKKCRQSCNYPPVLKIVAYTYNGILALKKMAILPFAALGMDQQDIMLSEISQIKKDKYCVISPIWGL